MFPPVALHLFNFCSYRLKDAGAVDQSGSGTADLEPPRQGLSAVRTGVAIHHSMILPSCQWLRFAVTAPKMRVLSCHVAYMQATSPSTGGRVRLCRNMWSPTPWGLLPSLGWGLGRPACGRAQLILTSGNVCRYLQTAPASWQSVSLSRNSRPKVGKSSEGVLEAPVFRDSAFSFTLPDQIVLVPATAESN